MDSGLLGANKKHYRCPQIFEVSSGNMGFSANSSWRQRRSQPRKLQRENVGYFNTLAARRPALEPSQGKPISEMRYGCSNPQVLLLRGAAYRLLSCCQLLEKLL